MVENAPPVAAGGVFFILMNTAGTRLENFPGSKPALLMLPVLTVSVISVFCIFRALYRPDTLRIRIRQVGLVLLCSAGALLAALASMSLLIFNLCATPGQNLENISTCVILLSSDCRILPQDRWMAEGRIEETSSERITTEARGPIILFGTGDPEGLGRGVRLRASGTITVSSGASDTAAFRMRVDDWDSAGGLNWNVAYRLATLKAIEEPLSRFAPDTASYLSALLLGKRTDPGSPLIRGFRNAGCMHLLALSGFHLGLIAMASIKLLQPLLGFRKTRLASILIVSVYILITGFRPSLVRSWFMFLIWSFASLNHLKFRALDVIAAAFVLQIVLFPGDVYDTGFILSYLALAGILSSGIRIAALLRRRLPAGISSVVGAGVAAQGFTLPVVVATFGVWRPVGLAAAPFITPFLILTMVCGSLTVISANLRFPIPPGFTGFCDWLVSLIGNLASYFGRIPGIQPDRLIIWLLSAGIAIIPFIIRRRTHHEKSDCSQPRFPCLDPCLSGQPRIGSQETMGTEFSY